MMRWYQKAEVCIAYLADVGDVYDGDINGIHTPWESLLVVDEFASSR